MVRIEVVIINDSDKIKLINIFFLLFPASVKFYLDTSNPTNRDAYKEGVIEDRRNPSDPEYLIKIKNSTEKRCISLLILINYN